MSIKRIPQLTLSLAAALVFSCSLYAQNAPPAAGAAARAADPKAPSPPAPAHDIQGVWFLKSPPSMSGFTNFTFSKDEPELTELGKQKYSESHAANGIAQYTLATTNDPVLTKCWPPGTPRVYFHPYPFEFVQTPKFTLMLFEYDHTIRRIYTDGRPVPKDPDITWMGTSVGHWEGDTTFVVDTVGITDRTWLDRLGHPHSTDLHVTERFRRVDRDHLQIDFIMTDPTILAKPWTSTFYYELRPTWEIGEISCAGDYLQFTPFEFPQGK